jgi:AcrR family transcriptional regulator
MVQPQMAAARRVRLQTDERRTQLLRLGIQLFASRPYDEISIDDVAEAAGISKGLLYHYFSGKQEFYIEAIRASSLRLRQLTEPDPLLPPSMRLRAAIDAHLNYIQGHGAVYQATYSGGITVAPEVNAILEEHRDVVMHRFLKNLGISRPRPVLRTALRAWIAMVEGASLDWIAHPELERDDLRELLVAAYVALLEKASKLDPKAGKNVTVKHRRTRASNG